MKMVRVNSGCTLCGLCEQPEVSGVFTYANGALQVKNSGIVDIDQVPKILEIEMLCPEKALEISNLDVDPADKASALAQFNQIINQDLREYPFEPPEYYRDYAYDIEKYQAIPVPAKYRSEPKYFTDESAENAGLAEFTRAVYSQSKAIAKQYLTAYRVRQLKKYYDYAESKENFYFRINSEISDLLRKAVLLASSVTEQTLDLPDDFCEFKVIPDWQGVSFSREKLKKLEELDVDLSRSGNFHSVVDYYRTWIDTDGDFRSCYYDFSEAEVELRDDINRAVSDIMESLVSDDVTYLTGEYLKRAKSTLHEKIKKLQSEVKKKSKISVSDQFDQKICELCSEIEKTGAVAISAPYPADFDTDYNDDYRFYSERECEKAAGNRRNRAYEEGLSFINRVPELLNDAYMEAFAELMTKWKRKVLGIYDLCGRPYPQKQIKVRVGESSIPIYLANYDDVQKPEDSTIRRYMEQHFMSRVRYGGINGVTYMSEYDCPIETNYDCDFRETLFGNIKEVNKRYAYYLNLSRFQISAWEVSKACRDGLFKSGVPQMCFEIMKRDFIAELQKNI